MKKIVYVSLLLSLVAAFPLRAQLSSAIANYNSNKFDKAKEKIDACLESEKLKGKSKMWYYRGQVYIAIAQNPAKIFGALKAANPDAIYVAYEALTKAMELEPKKRGYYKDAAKALKTNLHPTAINQGVEMYRAKNYNASVKAFELAQKTNDQSLLPFVYGGDVAREAKNKEKYEAALRGIIKFPVSAFEALLKKDELAKLQDAEAKKARLTQEKANYYAALVFHLRETKQYEEGVKVVEEGVKLAPNHENLRALQVELYVKTNKLDDAIKNLESAIDKNPKDVGNYVNLGIIYDKAGKTEKAEATYERCLKVDSENYKANFNLAVLQFNKAAKILTEIDKLTLPEYNKRGKKMEQEAVVAFKKALPYFEKLKAKKSDDMSVLRPLGKIYNFLSRKSKTDKKMYTTKYKEIEKAISGE
ncbi:tetratricopeptide repeat protein [uncultured Microscilla sp.]|uniref:tetratricopeptide repeat protein n=1 Tax=uncultured Microscilla sp. TaxID=432653 RepID=UPI0026068325|nr:tetratricopeptide repeat protein [uncultured Microscilla sp.]